MKFLQVGCPLTLQAGCSPRPSPLAPTYTALLTHMQLVIKHPCQASITYQCGLAQGHTIQHYLWICVPFKWFVSQTPYLVNHSSIAPHITGIGVPLEMQTLYVKLQ